MKQDEKPEPKKWLWLHREDNVAMSLFDYKPNEVVQIDGRAIALRNPVEYGHKFAIVDIAEGQPIVKYAETIGVASADISAGDHVHTHNVKSLRARKS